MKRNLYFFLFGKYVAKHSNDMNQDKLKAIQLSSFLIILKT